MTLIWGKVRRGEGRGKGLGFPTANIALHKKIPDGVYISQTKVNGAWHQSLTFIGAAITFNESQIKAETYLLNRNNLDYGKIISIKLIKIIRGNKKFKTEEELVEQMKKDEMQASNYFRK